MNEVKSGSLKTAFMDDLFLRFLKMVCRAAESLHIAQPSLPKQMMDMEKELGKQLLVRGKKKSL